MLVEMDI
jgi:hypothetical protein